MDLAQAEAVTDSIYAVSESAVQAAETLEVVIFQRIKVDEEVTELRAFVEATLDFPERRNRRVKFDRCHETLRGGSS